LQHIIFPAKRKSPNWRAYWNSVSVSEEPQIISKEDVHIAVFSIIDPEVFRFYSEDVTKSLEIKNLSDFIA